MKRTHYFIFISTVIFIIGCRKGITQTDEKTYNEILKVDSVSVKDSLMVNNTLIASYYSSLLIFDEDISKAMLDSIYLPFSNLKTYNKEHISRWQNTDKVSFFQNFKNQTKEYSASTQKDTFWFSKHVMKVRSYKNGFLQINYDHIQEKGKAGVETIVNEKIFDLYHEKVLRLQDVTSIPNSRLSQLLMKNIDKIANLQKNTLSPIKNSDAIMVETIPVTDNFYFDEQGIYFHYNPFEIAGYGVGDIIIPVYWKELQGTLNNDFSKRIKI
ncbi:RsiV family protein [Chryseobacterium sp.]|uniref:RsiV family protein n=1 Tax=Chryseobacterium sp. TaxID=1871047 RepID=UPI00388E8D42